MGGRSSSSNKTSTSSQTVDNKQTADGEAIIARAENGSVTINQTSEEAVSIVERGLDTADNAVNLSGDAVYQAIRFGEETLKEGSDLARYAVDTVTSGNQKTLDTLSRGFEQALQESREDSSQLMQKLITVGIPAIVIVMIWRKA
tara:strand:+ start:4407 stop:4841 length:435 start_codon:yes stop_codon:yes gene_type:complete